MKKFQVTITESDFKFGEMAEHVVDTINIAGETILDAIKNLRKYTDYCYDDQALVEWINSGDEWNAVVDDEFLLDLICEEDGKYYVMLAECMEFEFKEI